jgi:hypothetical protein
VKPPTQAGCGIGFPSQSAGSSQSKVGGSTTGGAVDASAVEASAVDASGVDASGVDVPGVEASGVDVPGVDVPGVEAPGPAGTLLAAPSAPGESPPIAPLSAREGSPSELQAPTAATRPARPPMNNAIRPPIMM